MAGEIGAGRQLLASAFRYGAKLNLKKKSEVSSHILLRLNRKRLVMTSHQEVYGEKKFAACKKITACCSKRQISFDCLSPYTYPTNEATNCLMKVRARKLTAVELILVEL